MKSIRSNRAGATLGLLLAMLAVSALLWLPALNGAPAKPAAMPTIAPAPANIYTPELKQRIDEAMLVVGNGDELHAAFPELLEDEPSGSHLASFDPAWECSLAIPGGSSHWCASDMGWMDVECNWSEDPSTECSVFLTVLNAPDPALNGTFKFTKECDGTPIVTPPPFPGWYFTVHYDTVVRVF